MRKKVRKKVAGTFYASAEVIAAPLRYESTPTAIVRCLLLPIHSQIARQDGGESGKAPRSGGGQVAFASQRDTKAASAGSGASNSVESRTERLFQQNPQHLAGAV